MIFSKHTSLHMCAAQIKYFVLTQQQWYDRWRIFEYWVRTIQVITSPVTKARVYIKSSNTRTITCVCTSIQIMCIQLTTFQYLNISHKTTYVHINIYSCTYINTCIYMYIHVYACMYM